MHTLNVKRFGFALGTTTAILFLGCVFVMWTAPHEVVIRFFNSLLHGWDVAPIMRWNMPRWEAAVGMVETFILGWLVGAMFAAFYNLPLRSGGNCDVR